MIQGTGGARKIRWGKEGKTSGKSGGVRIIYLNDSSDGKIYFVTVFGKDQKSDLTEAEKKAIKAFIKAL
ncbi:MAG: type II toxin-antitoxin system RelE/ParE family toxin [Spirochaetales bacterium]|nr:type II toxin-antitoxin system RelE/ParE family toxin [Spirochaetales bacterium]